MSVIDPAQAACPVPQEESDRILLGHGSGGQMSAALLRDVVVPALADAAPAGPLQDAAVLPLNGIDLVVSTDSYVVSPVFFPGGDIGALAVNGTVNDLAMRGAEPVALSLAFVIEEGFSVDDLRRVTSSVADAARRVGVPIVTGDTKVVDRGAADGLFVNTTGVGHRLPGARPGVELASPSDVVLLSGPIGLHGTAVLSAREGLGFDAEIASDTRPLNVLVRAMVNAAGDGVHVLRDPTRGGVASSLNEIAQASSVGMVLEESALPVPPVVAAACELLGLDPLHVANEGCLLAVVSPEVAGDVLAAMHSLPEGSAAVRVGAVVADDPGRVTMRTQVGGRRIVDMLVGEQLPRIC